MTTRSFAFSIVVHVSLFACGASLLLPCRLLAASAAPPTLADYRAIYEKELSVIRTNNAGVMEADKAYLAALEALRAGFKKQGDFDGITAVMAEQKRFAATRMVPDRSPVDLPPASDKAQARYRADLVAIEARRTQQTDRLTTSYLTALQGLIKSLLQQDKMAEAVAVNAEMKRVQAAAPVAKTEPANPATPPTTTAPPPSPIVPPTLTQTPRYPTGKEPWANSLGMKFVPVAETEVLFCIWETRVQDFRAFVAASGHDATAGMHSVDADGWKQSGHTWKNPGFSQGTTHPVCGVSWEDAQAFCQWLTKEERRKGLIGPDQEYRLPKDWEWSVAVGLDESRTEIPKEMDGIIQKVYPWGTSWPPPEGAGNFAGEECRHADWPSGWGMIPGYRDKYTRTSPVGSFKVNRSGLFDMSGNVWEWCEDFFDGQSGRRAIRGSSWGGAASKRFLSSHRLDGQPDIRYADLGFRCVLSLRDAPAR